MAIALATPRFGLSTRIYGRVGTAATARQVNILLSDAQQTNLGSIEFFLSCVGHPHHRLKRSPRQILKDITRPPNSVSHDD
jgi:hypothetical protein